MVSEVLFLLMANLVVRAIVSGMIILLMVSLDLRNNIQSCCSFFWPTLLQRILVLGVVLIDC
jgi:hypothetical protein